MPWYGKGWKSTVKAARYSVFLYGKFISLYVHVFTYKRKIVLCNYSHQDFCSTKDRCLGL